VQNLDKYKLLPGMRTIRGQLKLLLRHHRMPGDILTMTPLIRDIKKTYGDQVQIYCDTQQGQEIWQNNPYLTQEPIFNPHETYCIDNKMAAENESRGLNMAEGFRQDFMRQSGLHLIASDMWPDIFLTEGEIRKFQDYLIYQFGLLLMDVNQKFWVVCPGNKSSCQVKIWPRSRWMEFFEQNKEYTFIQIGQSKHGHKSFDLPNVINFIDKTTLRELFVLIYLSQGTIGYNSLHMHVAAAFKKPSIVLAGGRESPTLFKYPNHFVISMVGSLPCCQYGGCYKGKEKSVIECCHPYYFGDSSEIIPKCMDIDLGIINNMFRYISHDIDAFPMDKGRTDCIITVKEKFKVTLKDNRIEAILSEKELSEDEIKALKEKFSKLYKGPHPGEIFGYPYHEGQQLKGKPQKKPLFRMICNATCYGGGERTAVRIMHLMAAKGYDIEFVPATGEMGQSAELLKNLPKILDDMPATQVRHIRSKAINEADIVFFQANDTLYRYQMAKVEDWVAPWFRAAKRNVIGVNYMVWGLEKSPYCSTDAYICQSERLKNNLIIEDGKVRCRYIDFIESIHLLKPPAGLSRFFDYDYSGRKIYDAHINLVRHSSQGDQKYPNNINEQLKKISEIDSSTIVRFMPAPTFLKRQNCLGVASYPFNEMSVEQFLNYGNVFWYWVPKDKFIEAGCNAVLEAMAAGLPILCNDNGGLVDIIDNKVGWMCKTEDEMYDAIKYMTMDEIKKKGQAAREKVKKLVDPEAWTKIIIGE